MARREPCLQIEYDLTFFGGDYAGVGEFAYLPVSLVDRYDTVEEAFEARTGLDRQHIIHYSEDELYDEEGAFWDDEEEIQ